MDGGKKIKEDNKVPKDVTKAGGQMPFKHRLLIIVGAPVAVVASLVLAGFMVGGTLELLGALGVLEAIEPVVITTTTAAYLYALSIFILVGVPLVIWKKPLTSLKEIGLNRLPTWLDILVTPAAFVIYLLISGILLLTVTRLVPGFDAEQEQPIGFDSLYGNYEYALAFIALVVIAPIAEEVLMRGYLYGKLRKAMPVVLAMIITSVMFGVMHGQWNVALDTFALGMVMASLREMTGALWASILLHMAKNGVAFYVLFVNPSILDMIGG